MLPTFIVIGSQKAGTSSLYQVLRRHPQVIMSRKKEAHFFIHDRLYRRGMPGYAAFFREDKPDAVAVGEATPGYVCYPQVPARIRKHLPDVRLILTVRNPIERAHSQYWYARRHLAETLTFEESVARHLTPVYRPGERGYFSRGVYIHYVRRYMEHFPPQQLLVLLFDEMVASPASFYRKVFKFIGVEPDFECPEMEAAANPAFVWRNPVYQFFYRNPRYAAGLPVIARRLLCAGAKHPRAYPPIPAAVRQELVEFYRRPNAELAEFIGTDLDHWNR